MVCCPRSQTRATPSSDGSRPALLTSNPYRNSITPLDLSDSMGVLMGSPQKFFRVRPLAWKPYVNPRAQNPASSTLTSERKRLQLLVPCVSIQPRGLPEAESQRLKPKAGSGRHGKLSMPTAFCRTASVLNPHIETLRRQTLSAGHAEYRH